MALPLEGIRVLDFTRVMSGPFATMLLGDLGADVIKIEPPGGDDTRGWGPPWIGGDSAYFMSANRNKRSIIIDLKKLEGREIVKKLVEKSDVVVENFRPGVAEQLGISYDNLSKINPRIIYCSISGFGQSGPYRDKPGYDLIALAMSGLMSITGEPNRPPVKFGVPIADLTTALFAALSIVSALYWREKTGRGQYIDMALLDAQVLLLSHQAFNYFATGEEPRRMGSAHPNIVPYQAFETSDGYIIVTVGSEKLWEQFCKAIGRPDLIENPKFRTNADRVINREELIEELERVFKPKPTRFWIEELEKAGVPAAPILTVGQVLNDEHVRYRGMVLEIEHPEAGVIKMLGTPFKMSVTPGVVRSPPPTRGQHTFEILRELGFDDEEIIELKSKHVVE
ncbi:MAG: CoA transferase [Thaumarchaeota archaeon]|jgi:formyl-CoA transferase/CoA:oxalate CoA-transferase|nr:CoA transferase [Candidatus Geocrenenecus arthurdayi]MCL7403034.1 CoA transferase [Candidatus Geocrenenecus arthurdayi]